MTLERFNAATGANIVHVPYRSGGALMPDLIGGSIQAAMTEFSTALPLHKGGKAHIIAIAATSRSKLAPDIPTFIESGVEGFTAQSYIGIVAPRALRPRSSPNCKRQSPADSPAARRQRNCATWARKSPPPSR